MVVGTGSLVEVAGVVVVVGIKVVGCCRQGAGMVVAGCNLVVVVVGSITGCY